MQEPEPPAIPTFAEAARECHKANAPRWKNQRHTDAWLQTLERHAFPILGDMPVDQIERGHVLSVLEPIWGVRQETARRVRQRIRSIMRWCMAHDLVQVNVAGEAIDGALPPMPRLKARMRALDYRDVPDALGTVAKSYASLSAKLCFTFQVLTAVRSGEARGATWAEIDLERGIWIIPGARMKMGIDHRVPLSSYALEVLAQAELVRDETGLVFPSVNGKTLSDSTLSKLLRENGVDAVPHGFRSSFRDWAAESTQATWAAMELSLAHAVGSDVERAYSRSDLLQQRRELMEAWGLFLYGASKANIPTV